MAHFPPVAPFHKPDDWDSGDYSRSRKGGTEDRNKSSTSRRNWFGLRRGDTPSPGPGSSVPPRGDTASTGPSGPPQSPPQASRQQTQISFCECYYCPSCDDAPPEARGSQRYYRQCKKHPECYRRPSVGGQNLCGCPPLVRSAADIPNIQQVLIFDSSQEPQYPRPRIKALQRHKRARQTTANLQLPLKMSNPPRRTTVRVALIRTLDRQLSPHLPRRLAAPGILRRSPARRLWQLRIRTAHTINKGCRQTLRRPQTISYLPCTRAIGKATPRHILHQPITARCRAPVSVIARPEIRIQRLEVSLVRTRGNMQHVQAATRSWLRR